MRQKLSRFITAFLALLFMFGLVAAISPLRAAAGDCDDNAVIRCGVKDIAQLKQKWRENDRNTRAIYQAFGITSESSFDNMAVGRVTSSNQVYATVFGVERLVATNAISAGRQNMPGSTPIAGGAAYKRSPSVSFNSSSLAALVQFDANNQFKFAVVISCGNPVIATATPPTPKAPAAPQKPNFTVTKYDQVSGEGGWYGAVSTKPGKKVNFRILVKNTGETTLTNVIVRDAVPGGLTFVNGTVYVDGQVQSHLTPSHINIGSLAVGQTKEVTIQTQVGDNTEACGANKLTNVAYAKPDTLPEKSSTATVEVCKTVTTTAAPLPRQEAAPTSLPKTGSESVAGLFIGTSVMGMAYHRLREFFIRFLNK